MSSSIRLLLLFLLPMAAHPADVFVPDDLQDWQAWVLQDMGYRDCPFYFNQGAAERSDYICAWPGSFDITVDQDSGRFVQEWTVYGDKVWVQLPGGTSYWPDAVRVNGSAAVVIERNGRPSVRLNPGTWRITGEFEWDERPGVLPIPALSGILTLTVNGQRISASLSWCSRSASNCLAVISVLSPIERPVRGSVTPGSSGLKCQGRKRNQGNIFCAMLRPR